MLELARQLKCDPRACIAPFFERIQTADAEYKRQFEVWYLGLSFRILIILNLS